MEPDIEIEGDDYDTDEDFDNALQEREDRMGHHCHALGCKRACPPRWLMCCECWSKVPQDLQAEVYRTVKLRGPCADATWAPWWRAQAKAIAHVAFLVHPDIDKRDAYLEREMSIADQMERTP